MIDHILKEYPWIRDHFRSSNFYAEERFAKFQVGPCLYEGLPGGEKHIIVTNSTIKGSVFTYFKDEDSQYQSELLGEAILTHYLRLLYYG